MVGVVGGRGGNLLYLYVINEVLIDCGLYFYFVIIDIFVNGYFFIEVVVDGIFISIFIGLIVYFFLVGGLIVYFFVKFFFIIFISLWSLSFCFLVLLLYIKVVLRFSKWNWGRELLVLIDGKWCLGVMIGMEVWVEGEKLERIEDGWKGGVFCVIRVLNKNDLEGFGEDDDLWVGGLNGLLKFNYFFGLGF